VINCNGSLRSGISSDMLLNRIIPACLHVQPLHTRGGHYLPTVYNRWYILAKQ
jgi:hypothetical protein